MCMCMLDFLKDISHEPIGYNKKIGTGGVEWGLMEQSGYLDSTPYEF